VWFGIEMMLRYVMKEEEIRLVQIKRRPFKLHCAFFEQPFSSTLAIIGHVTQFGDVWDFIMQ
jgi:hypothetical protein